MVPAAARAKLASVLGSGAAPSGSVSPHVDYALHQAFVSALATGLKIGAAVALVGAFFALWLIGPARTQPADTHSSEQRTPEAVAA